MKRWGMLAVAVLGVMPMLACGSGSGGNAVVVATAVPAAADVAPAASAVPAATDAPVVAATAAPAALGKVGDTLEAADGTRLTVVSAERAAEQGQFLKAADGNEFVILEVAFENVGSGDVPYNPFYFKLKDGDGYEYNAGIAADRALSSGDLANGEKARGFISFEVPTGATGLVLTYEPITFGDTTPLQFAIE